MTNKFAQRSEEVEIMDDLEAGGPVMDQTLKELDVINKWLGGNHVTIDGVKKLVGKSTESLTIVDLGCGSGDILKIIAQWARSANINITLIGIDANPHVIAFAEKHAADYPEIEFRCINIFSEEFKKIEADIFTATLFTHHFDGPELSGLIKQLNDQARLGVVINDIHRHWFAYYSIKWLTGLFSNSPMVRNDAAVSVLRAFKKHDLIKCLEVAEAPKYQIKWRWAFRWQVVIFRK